MIKCKLIFLLLYCFLFCYNDLYSCNCSKKLSFNKEFKRSDIVLVGVVLKIEMVGINQLDTSILKIPIYSNKVSILISKMYKGELLGDTLIVYSGVGRGDCGFPFEVGETYIVYSVWKDKFYDNEYFPRIEEFLYTSICTRTRRVDITEINCLDKKLCGKKSLGKNRLRRTF